MTFRKNKEYFDQHWTADKVKDEVEKGLALHTPEEFKFSVQEKSAVEVSLSEKKVLHLLAAKLREREWTDIELHEEMYVLCKNNDLQPKDFFTAAYRVLINKEKGPRLAAFILEIGREKVAKLFSSV